MNLVKSRRGLGIGPKIITWPLTTWPQRKLDRRSQKSRWFMLSDYGKAVPDLDCTSETSALLIRPSTVKSSRKLFAVIDWPVCD